MAAEGAYSCKITSIEKGGGGGGCINTYHHKIQINNLWYQILLQIEHLIKPKFHWTNTKMYLVSSQKYVLFLSIPFKPQE